MKGPRQVLLVLFLSLLVSTLPAAATSEIEQPGPSSALSSNQVPLNIVHAGGVSSSWWSQVQKDIQQSEYEISWQEQTALPDLPAAYQAPNRAQGFRTFFAPRGIWVVPRLSDADWRLSLSLSTYGYDGEAILPQEAALVPAGNRIEYRRGTIDEWYANEATGLQYGIRLGRILPRAAGRPLQFDLSLSGTLASSISEDGRSIELTASDGKRLCYGNLVAYDSEARSLPARLIPSATGFSIQIEMVPSSFPVTVTMDLADSQALPGGLGLTPGWAGESNQANASYGVTVGTIGDVNGDGYSDIGVGAYLYDNGEADEGRAFVYYGSPSGPSLVPDWTAAGDQAGAWFGYPISTAGDVNGDGYADMIVGSFMYSNGQTGEGRAFVYYGSAAGLGLSPDWIAEGDQVDAHLGFSAGGAGDVNGDGYSDIIVGSPYYENGQHREGWVFVWYGSSAGLGPNGTPGNADWTFESNQADAELGYSTATAGDVNGDGYADVIVGSHHYGNGQYAEGRSFVFHGSPSGLSTSPNWTGESNQAGALYGCSVGTAGDVNGDGYSDVIVGAMNYDGSYTDEGGAWIYLGSSAGLSPSAAWTTTGGQTGAAFGYWVNTAGDVNGDGYADVAVGAWHYDGGQADEGRVYVYYGRALGPSSTADWTVEANQAGAHLGSYLSTAGDVNGDGYSDLIVGARYYDNGETDEGAAFVYYGSAVGLGSTPAWTAEGDQAGAGLGSRVASAGDVNGDGYGDVLVGAVWYDNGQTDEGLVLLYPGSADGLSTAPAWAVESDQANSDFGTVVGTAGDLNGDGYDDVVVGARYYDNDQTDEGRAYVYYGSSAGLPPLPNWTAEGNQANAYFGRGASTAGDVNGDGYADLLIGAPNYDNGQADEGQVYLYLGSAAGLGAAPDWTAEVDVADSFLGWWVNPAGDVNGDGYSDVIVGAPHYENGQYREGGAFVYQGSASGLSTSPDWHVEGNQLEAQLGYSVDTAGDVNGDGYADVIVGAVLYDNGQVDEGAVLAYYGSAAGLQTTPSWRAEANQAGAGLGIGLGGGGDVNGDGYSDVIVGAYLYDNGQADEGKAWVYQGSPAGLSPNASWAAEGNQVGAGLGQKVEFAGDVNGDGYADVIVGALYYDNDQADEGRAFLYYGNAGPGLSLTPRQLRTDGSVQIAPLGISDAGDAFQLRLTGRMPLGREKVKLQYQVAPLGTPFTATGVISGTSNWIDTGVAGTVIVKNVTGLEPARPYHWRTRLLYHPGNRLGQPASRWLTIPWNGWSEKDLRTADEPIAGLAAVNDSPTELGRQTMLTATVISGTLVHYSWDLGDGQTAEGPAVTHVYTPTGVYTAVVTAWNDVSQAVATTPVTVYCDPPYGADFSWAPIAPTVGEEVSFYGSAEGTGPLGFLWDFGDGGTGAGSFVQHVYTATGAYTVTMLVRNVCGEVYAIHAVAVVGGCNPPGNLAFTWDPAGPAAGEPVAFAGSSAGTPPLDFGWSFGSSGITATHVFTPAGDYPVTMTVTNACGQDALLQAIHACEPVHGVTLAWSPEIPVMGQVTAFTGTAAGEGPFAYSWDMGDGSVGMGMTVTHSYSAPGDYTVTMSVTNTCSRASVQRLIRIACEQVREADFSWFPTAPEADQPIILTAVAQGGEPLAYRWDMGDGNMDTGLRPVHTYVAWGDYTVVLTVSNACSEQAVAHVVHVCGPAEEASFTWSPLQPASGQAMTLTAGVQGEPPFTYDWALGDGSAGSGPVVTHSYRADGVYSVTLNVTNGCGASRVVRAVTVVAPVWRVYLPAIVRQNDPYEPDNSWEQAGPILPGQPQYHSISPEEDQDWVVFAAQAGKTYDILVYGAGSALDSFLDLYGPDGTTPIDANDDCSTPEYASCLSFTPGPGDEGNYYARVSDYNWSGGPTGYEYQIEVRVGQ